MQAHQHVAEAAFHDAVTAISRLHSLFGTEGQGLEKARTHLSRYAEAVVRDEWVSGNTQPSPRASEELEQLRQELIRATERVPTAFGNHLWSVFDELVKARSARLWIGKQGHSEQPWALVLFACTTTACYWLPTRAMDRFAGLDTSDYLQAISG